MKAITTWILIADGAHARMKISVRAKVSAKFPAKHSINRSRPHGTWVPTGPAGYRNPWAVPVTA